jgi:hypothetical protein
MRSLIIILFIAISLGAESRFIGGAGNRIPGKIRAFGFSQIFGFYE